MPHGGQLIGFLAGKAGIGGDYADGGIAKAHARKCRAIEAGRRLAVQNGGSAQFTRRGVVNIPQGVDHQQGRHLHAAREIQAAATHAALTGILQTKGLAYRGPRARAASALGQAQQVLDQVPPDAPWLYLPGAAGPEFVRRFVQQRDRHRCGLILVDGLSIVAGDDALRHLFLMERPLRVLRPLRVAFVAANPYSPSGRRFDNAAFLAALRAVTDLTVINVLEDDAIAPNE